jgi:hypothetical protein
MEEYWFKRKKYGYGWTPATREGWFVTLTFIAVVIFFATNGNLLAPLFSSSDSLWSLFFSPLVFSVVAYLIIVYRTGEPGKWQWGEKK